VRKSCFYHGLGRWVGKIGSSRLMLPSATNTKDCWHTSQRCFSCRLTKAISSRLPQVRQRTSMVVSRFSVSRFVAVVVVFAAVGSCEATVATVTSLPHRAHLKVRPVALSGARSLAPQDEQAIESGMIGVPKRIGATTQRGAPSGPAKGLNEQPGRRPFRGVVGLPR
jgi:hypothetical protein